MSPIRKVISGLAVALLAAICSAQQDTTDSSVERGHTLFTDWCATCHGSGPGHGGTTALAFKYKNTKPSLLEDRTDLKPGEVAYFVRHGISIMPFFRKTELGDRELGDIETYLSRNSR